MLRSFRCVYHQHGGGHPQVVHHPVRHARRRSQRVAGAHRLDVVTHYELHRARRHHDHLVRRMRVQPAGVPRMDYHLAHSQVGESVLARRYRAFAHAVHPARAAAFHRGL